MKGAVILVVALGLAFAGTAEAGKKRAQKKNRAAVEVVEAPAEPDRGAAIKQHMLGVWLVQFDEKQRRQFDLMAISLRDPSPSEEELAALNLTEEEKMLVGMMVLVKTTDPDGDQMKHLQAQLDAMKSVTMAFENDRLVFSWGELVDESTYEIVSAEDGSLQLMTVRAAAGTEDIHQLKVVDTNTIQLTDKDGETLELRRKE